MIAHVPKRITQGAEAGAWIRTAAHEAHLEERRTGKTVQQVWENKKGKLEFQFAEK